MTLNSTPAASTHTLTPTAQILRIGEGFEVFAPRGYYLSIGWRHSRVVRTQVEAQHVAKFLTPCGCVECMEEGRR